MKYGYIFHDWGLFEVVELHEVKELDKDYHIQDQFGNHVFTKDKWVVVKTYRDAFIGPVVKRDDDLGYWGLFYKEHIFDTEEEAKKYGRENSNCFGVC